MYFPKINISSLKQLQKILSVISLYHLPTKKMTQEFCFHTFPFSYKIDPKDIHFKSWAFYYAYKLGYVSMFFVLLYLFSIFLFISGSLLRPWLWRMPTRAMLHWFSIITEQLHCSRRHGMRKYTWPRGFLISEIVVQSVYNKFATCSPTTLSL